MNAVRFLWALAIAISILVIVQGLSSLRHQRSALTIDKTELDSRHRTVVAVPTVVVETAQNLNTKQHAASVLASRKETPSKAEYYRKLNDAVLVELVATLQVETEHSKRSFQELSELRRASLERGDAPDAERLYRGMVEVSERRRKLIVELTEAAFERTCRLLTDCDDAARRAFFDR